MLLQVMPEKVSEYWDFFAPMLAKSLPRAIVASRDGMASVLRAILLERLHVWTYERDDSVMFIMTTTIQGDPVTSEKWLLIYTLSSISNKDVTKNMFLDALDTLKKFAKSCGAPTIRAYTADRRIAQFVKSVGGKADEVLLEFNV